MVWFPNQENTRKGAFVVTQIEEALLNKRVCGSGCVHFVKEIPFSLPVCFFPLITRRPLLFKMVATGTWREFFGIFEGQFRTRNTFP